MNFFRNDKQLPNFLEYIDCPIILLSLNYTIVDINQLALTIYDWQKKSVLEENFLTLLEKSAFENPIPEDFFASSKCSVRDTQTTIHKKYQKIIIKWKISALFNDENIPQGIILTGQDMTEQRKLEDKIYELDSIVAQMPGNVYWYDKNNTYLGCNENSAKTLGMPREEAIGKNFETLMRRVKGIAEESTNQWVQDGRDVMQTKTPKLNIEEVPFIGPNNEMAYMVSNKVPLLNKNGELYGVVGISTDITKRKKTELELKDAKERAEVANHTKSYIMASLGHKFRAPLSHVIDISCLLKNNLTHFSTTEQIEYLDDIHQAGNELLKLILDLLSYLISQQDMEYEVANQC